MIQAISTMPSGRCLKLAIAAVVACRIASSHPCCGAEPAETARRYFAIEVVDSATGRGVPLVELETVNHQSFVTDSSGLVAIDEPDLLGHSVFFHIRSHGYEFPKDGFGFRGKALEVKAGGHERLKLKRSNIAERLYRITGGGIYRDTVLLGREPPIRQPLLAAKVVGCDSVCSAVYRDRIYWFWGDTLRPSYPLGNFHTTGATTPLARESRAANARGVDPDRGIDFDYFTGDDGFVRPMAQVAGDGPTWIGGLTVLTDDAGRERMYASYVKIRPPLTPYEHGLLVWNDQTSHFEKLTTFDKNAPINLEPQLHTFQHTDADGKRYIYFTGPLPWIRVPANEESLADPARYEGFSCLQPGTRLNERKLDRDEHGRLRYAWKPATAAVYPADQLKLVAAGLLTPGESIAALRDVDSGRAVIPHRGSVYWNAYRKRWVLIVTEIGGESSHLGEVWFAEANAPEGPWVYARKILTHDRYSFYNPKHHDFFDRDGGRIIYFEGTYTRDFSGNPLATPRYEYNQVMHKLDLADERLNLPRPIFDESSPENDAQRPVAFFALDRPSPASIPVYAQRDEHGQRFSVTKSGKSDQQPAFHAFPVEMKNPPRTTALIYEFTSEKSQQRHYSSAEQLTGFRRTSAPICRVWKNPIEVPFAWREENAK